LKETVPTSAFPTETLFRILSIKYEQPNLDYQD